MPRTDRNQLRANLPRRVDKRQRQIEKLRAENDRLEKGIETLTKEVKENLQKLTKEERQRIWKEFEEKFPNAGNNSPTQDFLREIFEGKI